MENTQNNRPQQDEINPAYTHTRQERLDYEVLKDNKIISLFPENPVVDQLKILDTQVINKIKEIGGNTLLITSAEHGSGKTLTAINLAISLSQKVDLTVLLVDADLRSSSVHSLLGIPVQRGLSDYLLKDAEIPELLINPGIAKLVILPAGKPLTNSTELLSSPRMRDLIREMKERYPERIIIFDCPPLLSSADTQVFSNYVDGIILVVEAEKTSANNLNKVIKLLKNKPLIGTVFNKVK